MSERLVQRTRTSPGVPACRVENLHGHQRRRTRRSSPRAELLPHLAGRPACFGADIVFTRSRGPAAGCWRRRPVLHDGPPARRDTSSPAELHPDDVKRRMLWGGLITATTAALGGAVAAPCQRTTINPKRASQQTDSSVRPCARYLVGSDGVGAGTDCDRPRVAGGRRHGGPGEAAARISTRRTVCACAWFCQPA